MRRFYTSPMPAPNADIEQLIARIREEAATLGFTRFGVSGIAVDEDAGHLRTWLQERHGITIAAIDDFLRGFKRVVTIDNDGATKQLLHFGCQGLGTFRFTYEHERQVTFA